jgi:hypothetical protein
VSVAWWLRYPQQPAPAATASALAAGPQHALAASASAAVPQQVLATWRAVVDGPSQHA